MGARWTVRCSEVIRDDNVVQTNVTSPFSPLIALVITLTLNFSVLVRAWRLKCVGLISSVSFKSGEFVVVGPRWRAF